ncbi:TolC family protein [Telluria aromaticivorans]|uniref:TolC family protein n=1 Tax=Telluria aromaticivorans TaxID=2725995 RepID=A0A7Y2JX37_9BURK|nr:TolC family protein [Telluria aromaticivorans]NNG22520.1 TolC family protein [Telluria aromaticivorans]
MRTCRLSLYLIGVALVLPCQVIAAPSAPTVVGTTLKQAVESAWQRAPAARTVEARQDEVLAARDNARSWLASNPTLGLSQRTDQGSSERDQRESEISISSSFWLPGQKSAREALAARSTEEVTAHIGATRLAVAGLVRNRMWEAAAAQVRLEEKQDHLHHLEGLLDEVQRRVKAGDLARSDGLLAQQEVLAARIDVANARTAAFEALARYRALTGLPDLPALDPEPLPDGNAPANPRLAAAQASEQRARAALRLAAASRSAPPTIALSVRREDERLLREPVNSIGVALQIPIGTAARNRTNEAQAQTVIATVAAEAAEIQANAVADIEIAKERLANARTALETATARAAALHEHTALFEKAFRQGEKGLAELLRSRALTHEADVAVAQQKVALGLAHAQFNQALGILP